MWSTLASDLLAHIFSFLSPNSLAIATLTCKHWHSCIKAYPLCKNPTGSRRQPPWFITFPNRTKLSYAYDPILDDWHEIALDFLPEPARPVAPIGSLLLFKPQSSTSLQLALCNPFTRQCVRHLPVLNVTRTNPAVGMVEVGQGQFQLYVAGGMREAPLGGASYEPTLEMYDSRQDKWETVGSMPSELAVRVTVWTPNESVHCDGALYWITSSRAYSIMRYEMETNAWTEVRVPMADRIGFAALVRRNGRATLVGGTCDGDVHIWEVGGEGNLWVFVTTLPDELGKRFSGVRGSWRRTKCVGNDGSVWLYRDLWSGMVVWREVVEKGTWEWFWVNGCRSIRGSGGVQNCPVRAVLLHPCLAHSLVLEN